MTPYREKRNVTFLLKGIVKWQDFQEHLPVGRQGSRSNGLGHPADCISAGNGLRTYRQAALYPSPPVLPAGLTALVSAYTTAQNAAIAAVVLGL